MTSRLLRGMAALTMGAGFALAACGTEWVEEEEETEEAREVDQSLTAAQREAARAKCAAIRPGAAWSKSEADVLLKTVVDGFSRTKKNHDRLIAERGIGSHGGVRTEVMKALSAGNRSQATSMIASRVKRGHDAAKIASEIRSTSCIGWVYQAMRDAYKAVGRSSEWSEVEACARAWDSDGLHLQQALMFSGWPSPALGFAGDEKPGPGWSAREVGEHTSLMTGVRRGVYWDVPLSTTVMMKNFLPSPGSRTPKDERMLLEIGNSDFFSVSTLRGAYHVPIVVPAKVVPSDLAPASGAARTQWLAAKSRGEPFVLESHSLRQPWDPTNFEIRPLTEVMSETFTQDVKYSVGTMLFSPPQTGKNPEFLKLTSMRGQQGTPEPEPEPEPEPQPQPQPQPQPEPGRAPAIGGACAPGCIYSAYCIAHNATAPRYTAPDGQPLVCVKVGDCRSTCAAQ